jgi:hypothetical protein
MAEAEGTGPIPIPEVAESEPSPSHAESCGSDTSQAESRNGDAPPQEDYPIADFYEPVTWGWTKQGYKIRRAVKEFSEHTHADY